MGGTRKPKSGGPGKGARRAAAVHGERRAGAQAKAKQHASLRRVVRTNHQQSYYPDLLSEAQD
eukprot:COSAG05_NODE_1793_length_4082_cov_2.602310_2_plen_63_part_00